MFFYYSQHFGRSTELTNAVNKMGCNLRRSSSQLSARALPAPKDEVEQYQQFKPHGEFAEPWAAWFFSVLLAA